MSEPTEKTGIGYAAILFTGIVSLVVGVVTGLILNYFNEPKVGIEYAVVSSEVFSGPTQNLAIAAIEVRNVGRREVENMKVEFELPNGQVNEFKVVGIPAASYSSTSTQPNSVTIEVPFFNPGESASIQLFITLSNGQFLPPIVNVRAKGATATQNTNLTGDETKDKDTLTLILPIFLSLFAMTVLQRKLLPSLWPRISKKHSDDQRDIAAYILSINDLHSEADIIRTAERTLHYWAISDLLVERFLISQDENAIKKGIKSLSQLLDYAQIAASSREIINFNIARLAMSINDVETATTRLKQAFAKKSGLILTRIQMDEALTKIATAAGLKIKS